MQVALIFFLLFVHAIALKQVSIDVRSSAHTHTKVKCQVLRVQLQKSTLSQIVKERENTPSR